MTPRETDALRFIASYAAAHGGGSPSFPEIAAALGVKSLGNVHRYVNSLQRKGYLTYSPGLARSIRLDRAVDYGRLVSAATSLLKAFQAGRVTAAHWHQLECALPRAAPDDTTGTAG